jgi:enterochelin esterase-like enzyme
MQTDDRAHQIFRHPPPEVHRHGHRQPEKTDQGTDQDSFKEADSELARKLGVVLHVYPGGHDSAYWNSHMPEYIAFYRQACGR